MAFNPNTTHSSLNLRVKYYGHKYKDNDTKLLTDDKVKGLFYARKHANTTTDNYITQTGIKTVKKEMTLYTDDFIHDLEQDDFVVLENRKWIVTKQEEVIIAGFRGKRNWQGVIITLRS